MERIFGGSPIAVVLRLVVISIIVGVILSVLHIRPLEVFRHLDDVLRHLTSFGAEAFRFARDYFLMGAVIVIPVWVLYRLIHLAGGGKRGRGRTS